MLHEPATNAVLVPRHYISLNWNDGTGRKAGCFDAEPRVSYTPYVERSLEEIKTQFNLYRQEWDASEAKVELQQHMAQIIKHNRLSNVVSFGTGGFDTGLERHWRRTSFQICALTTMVESINEGRPKEQSARYFSQDPVYTENDKEILRSIGIEPVVDPDGFVLSGKNSVVCEWATYDCITRKVSERPWPAVMINGTGELEKFTELVERDESVEYDSSFQDSVCQRDILIGVHKNSRYHQTRSGQRILIFETINPTEASQILDMYKDREQLPLSAFPYLSDLSPDSIKEDNVFWQPTIYWRTKSDAEGEEKRDTGEAIIDMYLE
ncbi:MAG: hypothetical protein Q9226_002916 [Calogaya cf. arnoldii]